MTKLERKQDFQLRMALKVKKKSHPDRPWIIRGVRVGGWGWGLGVGGLAVGGLGGWGL